MDLCAIYHLTLGVVIEDMTEEATVLSDNCENLTSESSFLSQEGTTQSKSSRSASIVEPQSSNNDYLKALKDDPESIRFHCSQSLFAVFLCKL